MGLTDNIADLARAATAANEDVGTANNAKNALLTNQVCADCTVSIDSNRLDTSADAPKIFVVSEVDNRPLPEMEGWFTVREINGPNTAVFSSTNLDDESILGIATNVGRGSSALITYGIGADAVVTDVNVKHSEATIEIQSPDDVWTSGLAIPIVLVDGDTNKNSRDGNDVDLTDPDSIIPTLITGNPFTISERVSATWIGWNIAGAQPALTLLNREDMPSNIDRSFFIWYRRRQSFHIERFPI